MLPGFRFYLSLSLPPPFHLASLPCPPPRAPPTMGIERELRGPFTNDKSRPSNENKSWY